MRERQVQKRRLTSAKVLKIFKEYVEYFYYANFEAVLVLYLN